MALLAKPEDVEARLRRELTEDESSHIDDLLEEASSLVTEHCRGRVFDPVPDAVRIVTSRVAARALSVAASSEGVELGVESTELAAGPFRQVRSFTADAVGGSMYLTAADRRQLRRWSRSGVWSFDTR